MAFSMAAAIPSGFLEKLPAVVKKGMVAFVLLSILALFIAMCVAPPQDVYPVNDYAEGVKPRTDYYTARADAVSTADMSWMLASTALVLIMTPGLAFFYGGMINHKNVVGTIAACIIPMGVIPLMWSFIGYSLAFGEAVGPNVPYNSFLGNPKTYGLMYNVGAVKTPDYGYTDSTFWTFQCMFAIITPAIMVGAIADRVNFASLLLFIPMWHMAVYCPMAHMVWGGGLIYKYGVWDFAGGMVVHMSSGWGALAAALFLGPRAQQSNDGPANPPYVMLGASLLWFGWFGFNGGSALGSSDLTSHAFLNTVLATATAMFTWVLFDQLRGKPFKMTGMAMGIVVGLVAITPACGFVCYGAGIIIGFIGSLVSWLTQWGMEKWGKARADDTLDVFAAHGMGGTTGMILTSLFQDTEAGSWADYFNTAPDGSDYYIEGAFYGNGKELGKCLLVLVCIVGYFLTATYFLCMLTNVFISMRVTDEEEEEGLDFSKHYEGPYKGEEDA